jgi:hypothetical protein
MEYPANACGAYITSFSETSVSKALHSSHPYWLEVGLPRDCDCVSWNCECAKQCEEQSEMEMEGFEPTGYTLDLNVEWVCGDLTCYNCSQCVAYAQSFAAYEPVVINEPSSKRQKV